MAFQAEGGCAVADGCVGPAPTPAVDHADCPGQAAIHKACLNCGAPLHGRYCSDCAQSSEDHHRPILRLLWEGVEGLTHLDGRLARTLPLLFFGPGRLARDHLEGRRARHVPPFRLFLISLFLFMLALEGAVDGGFHGRSTTITIREGAKAKVVATTPNQMADLLSGEKTPEQVAGENAGRKAITAESRQSAVQRPRTTFRVWIRDRLQRALTNPAYFEVVVFTWAHRLAILLLPIFAAQLALLHAWRRQFCFYDHLEVSMQFLAFVFLISGLAWLAPNPVRGALIAGAALWVPANLYMLLRGAYGSGVVGALARTVWLWLSTQIVFIVLVAGLLVLGLQEL